MNINSPLLKQLHSFCQFRLFWCLIALTGFSLLGVALYFQHVLDMKPCFLCINQRIAVFLIGVAGVIGAMAPSKKGVLWTGYVLWGLASIFGLGLAIYQTYLQLNPPEFGSCGADMDFILANNSLFEAIPMLLQPTGTCSDVSWSFLGLTMPQWMVFIFSVSLIINLFYIINQKRFSQD